mgnify:CR=1 FL=1
MNFKSRIIIGCLLGHAHCKYRRKRLISIVSIFVIRQKLLTLSAVRKLIFRARLGTPGTAGVEGG